MVNALEKGVINFTEKISFRFIDPSLLPLKALTGPNYRLKQLQEDYWKTYPITCSKCHHCR